MLKETIVGEVRFKLTRHPPTDEYVVRVYEKGRHNEARDYYTNDKQDAEMTMNLMVLDEHGKAKVRQFGCGSRA